MTSDTRSGLLLAGIDIGSTHCKALLCGTTGTVIARAQRPTPRSSDGLTHDAEEFRSTGTAHRSAPSSHGPTRHPPHTPDASGKPTVRRHYTPAPVYCPAPRCHWRDGAGCASTIRSV
jgi:hypothetical protein